MSGFGLGALLMVFGLMALLPGLAALVMLLSQRRLSRLATGICAASVVAVIGCLSAMPPGYSAAEQERITRLHQQLAPSLERYRQAHGEYPPTLEAAGIPTPQTEYGPLGYRNQRAMAPKGAPYYQVWFGDYLHHGFTAWWDTDSREWSLDQ